MCIPAPNPSLSQSRSQCFPIPCPNAFQSQSQSFSIPSLPPILRDATSMHALMPIPFTRRVWWQFTHALMMSLCAVKYVCSPPWASLGSGICLQSCLGVIGPSQRSTHLNMFRMFITFCIVATGENSFIMEEASTPSGTELARYKALCYSLHSPLLFAAPLVRAASDVARVGSVANP